eukprot:9485075-Pyramimonas_sp.AAC.1
MSLQQRNLRHRELHANGFTIHISTPWDSTRKMSSTFVFAKIYMLSAHRVCEICLCLPWIGVSSSYPTPFLNHSFTTLSQRYTETALNKKGLSTPPQCALNDPTISSPPTRHPPTSFYTQYAQEAPTFQRSAPGGKPKCTKASRAMAIVT